MSRHPGSTSVETLADEIAIARLLAAHQRAISEDDAAAFAATFTPDGVLEHPFGRAVGRDALAAFLVATRREHTGGVRDVVVNVEVAVDGAAARSRAVSLVLQAGAPPAQLLASGVIEDDLVRDAGGCWRIRRHVIRPDPAFAGDFGGLGARVSALTARVQHLEARVRAGA